MAPKKLLNNQEAAPKKLLSNQEAREAAQEFLLAAKEGLQQFKERYDQVMQGRLSVRFGLGGVGIVSTARLNQAQSNLAEICVRLLTTKVASEVDIIRVAWAQFHQFAARTDQDCASAFAVSFLQQLQDDCASKPVHFMPNYGIRFVESVRSLDLGVVQVRMTEDILPELKRNNWQILSVKHGVRFHILHQNLSKMLSGQRADSIPGRTIVAPEGTVDIVLEESSEGGRAKIAKAELQLEFPSSCWRVNVNALHGAVPEEALWLVNIAMSLVRLYFPPLRGNTPPGGFGARDNHPTLRIESQQPSITLDKAKSSAEGSHSGLQYAIGNTEKEHFEKIGLKKLADRIYHAKPKSIAERIGQGLGWLSRGRQGEPRSERFLFFFTALEALLSGDKSVTQTIARHAAVIMSDDPAKRALLARELQSLYALRSTLVHTGKRSVSSEQAARSQELVETLYRSVLQKVDIGTEFVSLLRELTDASYGLPWLPDGD
jgi:hypothetical protein